MHGQNKYDILILSKSMYIEFIIIIYILILCIKKIINNIKTHYYIDKINSIIFGAEVDQALGEKIQKDCKKGT